ncbi:MAG: DUF192 domain-containing protein [Methylomonas sp.]|jgi:uncharacterized membrane protein (UPF0127 family)
MNSRFLKPLGVLFFIIISILESHAKNLNIGKQYSVFFIEPPLEIKAELAVTAKQREQGLMYRTHLEENQGMLFVFPDQEVQVIWMKNTYIALDVLFIGADGLIVSMLPGVAPCRKDPCNIYESKAAAKYMLEMNSGFIQNHGMKIGSPVILPFESISES